MRRSEFCFSGPVVVVLKMLSWPTGFMLVVPGSGPAGSKGELMHTDLMSKTLFLFECLKF